MPSPSKPPVLVPLIVSCALFMENLDSTVIATAIPTIAESIGTSPLHLSLAVTSYMLSLAVFIPLSGWMADRFGARRVFMAAIATFMAGSALCGQASSLEGLVGARVVQGMGGAMMVPVGRIVLLRSVPKSELVRAMAYLTIPALVGPVMGPPLGGLIVTYASWRWIFYVNIPIGLLGLALVYAFVRDERAAVPPPLDLKGWVLAGMGLVSVVFAVETIGRGLMPVAATAALGAFGAAMLALYARHSRAVPRPILAIDLLRLPSYGIAILGGALFRVGVGAIPILLPLMLQLGFGMSPLESGTTTLASAVGALAMKTAARPILRRLGFRTVLVGNAVISGGLIMGYGLLRPETPHALIVGLLLMGGFFRSLQFTSINTLAFADVAPERVSQASSLSSTFQHLFLTVGVGLGATLLQLVLLWRGGTGPTPEDFSLTFMAIGLVSASSVLVFMRLAPDAGDEVSGRARAEAD